MHDPTRRNEDEYFAREDAELMANLRRALDAKRTAREQAAQQMRCPSCDTPLTAREFHGVTIDVCPKCGGAWLDRGELEMLARVDEGNAKRYVTSLFDIGR